MKRWTKRRIAGLQLTIESAHMNTSHASATALAIWEEWKTHKGLTTEERESLIDCLMDAKIQIGIALGQLE